MRALLAGEAHTRAIDALADLFALDAELVALERRCAIENLGPFAAVLYMHEFALNSQRDHRDPWADFTAHLKGGA